MRDIKFRAWDEDRKQMEYREQGMQIKFGKHLGDNGGEYGFLHGFYLETTEGAQFPLHADEEYQVIGNIYENPELLSSNPN